MPPFRRFPKPELAAAWAESTPESFRFAVKAHQGITHRARLADTEESVFRRVLSQGARAARRTPGTDSLPVPPLVSPRRRTAGGLPGEPARGKPRRARVPARLVGLRRRARRVPGCRRGARSRNLGAGRAAGRLRHRRFRLRPSPPGPALHPGGARGDLRDAGAATRPGGNPVSLRQARRPGTGARSGVLDPGFGVSGRTLRHDEDCERCTSGTGLQEGSANAPGGIP